MYRCPWCEGKTFSFLQKQTLGPTRTMDCAKCKRKVGVHFERAQFAASPVILLGFLGLLFGRELYGSWSAVLLGGWLGITLGMACTAPLYHWLVPLVRE